MASNKLTQWMAAALLACGLAGSALAQQEVTLDAKERAAIVDGVLQQIESEYMRPEQIPAIQKKLREQLASGAYDKLTTGTAFATQLTADLQSVSHDKHMFLRSRNAATNSSMTSAILSPAQRKEAERRGNYGVKRVEILDGNVGYLKVDSFADAENGGAAVAAAMQFLQHSEALIIDLRDNSGGGHLANVLLTYLFSGQPQLLQTVSYPRRGDSFQFSTSAFVPGPRYLDKPVYVLTSRRTFSAGESFSYSLKHLKRGLVVGENTAGAGNPNMFFPVGAHFSLSVPIGLAVHAVTGTNWEGVGVEPDVKVSEKAALPAARRLALQALLDKADDPARRAQLEKALKETND